MAQIFLGCVVSSCLRERKEDFTAFVDCGKRMTELTGFECRLRRRKKDFAAFNDVEKYVIE